MAMSSEFFTGRHEHIKILREFFRLRDGNSQRRRIFVLYGIGGIGKLQITINFVEENSELCVIPFMKLTFPYQFGYHRRFSQIIWIDATNAGTVEMGLHDIARELTARTSNVEDSSDSVLRWLAQLKEEWLIIYDNAGGDSRLIEEHVPSGSRENIEHHDRPFKNPTMRELGKLHI